MRRIVAALMGWMLVAASPATPAPPDLLSDAQLELLRATDLRLATIVQRLVTANAALCRDLQPEPGIILQASDQYPRAQRPGLDRVMGFPTPVAVEAVVPGSPADGVVQAGDGVTAINGRAIPAPAGGSDTPTSATRDAANAILADAPADRAVTLAIVRDGRAMTVIVPARAGCRTAYEVLIGPTLTASSDGHIVQIGSQFFEKYSDDQIAVVVAHELSHTILRHRARLEAAGVHWGVFAEFGRNGRLFRRTEDDADILGMYLMRNAGYDPRLAVTFWRTAGKDVDGGLFRARTHASASARADAIAAEIARIPPDAPVPCIPPILATRDQPLK